MKKELINPVERISAILEDNGYPGGLVLEHVTYDKSLNEDYDYQIIRSSTHDGTFLFTINLIDETLTPVINKATYCKKDDVNIDEVKDIRYIIGDLMLKTEFDSNKQIDTMYLPIRCEYVY